MPVDAVRFVPRLKKSSVEVLGIALGVSDSVNARQLEERIAYSHSNSRARPTPPALQQSL